MYRVEAKGQTREASFLARYSEIRPEARPNQVRSRDEIEVGKTYIPVHINDQLVHEEQSPIKILTEPFQDKEGGWWIRAMGLNQKPLLPDLLNWRSLEDMSIEPHLGKSGDKPLWNLRNYLLKLSLDVGAKAPSSIERMLLPRAELKESDKETKLSIRFWNNHDYILREESVNGQEIVDRPEVAGREGDRIIRLGQVLAPENLRPGETYNTKHEGQSWRDSKFKVLSEPYKDEKGRMVVDIERKFGTKQETVKMTIDLGVYGVVPFFEV